MYIELAISPCPNDTFIFYHLAHLNEDFKVKLEFADIQELNQRAISNQKHIVTKLSFSAYLKIQKHYKLLNTGGALGFHCGPILISSENVNLKNIRTIAVPGKLTTAYNLLILFLKSNHYNIQDINFVYLSYDKIIPLLLDKNSGIDYGIIIHEERFSYQKLGLHTIQDLGEWWHEKYQLPIPLGCITIKKDYYDIYAQKLTEAIRKSLAFARMNPHLVWNFVKEHAQSLEDKVIQAHIDLYVNKYTEDFGEEGFKAIELFSEKTQDPF